MFETGFSILDFFHIALLLATCFACYVAGRINGASNMVIAMLDYKILTEKDLDKLQKRMEEE